MAFAIRCAISEKPLSPSDHRVCFPPFPHSVDEKIVQCSDACVLRSELDKWPHKSEVIKVAFDLTKGNYLTNEWFQFVYQDEEWFVIKGLYENKCRFYFIPEYFSVTLPLEEIGKFVIGLRQDKAETRYSNNTIIRSERSQETCKITWWVKDFTADCIILKSQELEKLISILESM